MQFSKMHGLGNDFMVVDAVTQNVFFAGTDSSAIRQTPGVGFDQLLVVEPPYDPELDFHYRIFNADGSEVSQCGNGARCFARFVRLKGLTNKRDIRVSTANGRMVLSVTEDELVRVNMGNQTLNPRRCLFAPTKRKRRILCERRNRPYCAAWFQWVIRTVSFRLITSTRRPLKHWGRFWKAMSVFRNAPTLVLCRL